MNEPHRTNELIIVFHRNEDTLHWIRGMFWQTLEKQIERQNNNKKKINCLEKIPKLIKFIGGSNVIDIETQQLFRVGEYRRRTNFKVFCDDLNWDFGAFDTGNGYVEIQDVIDRSNFWWSTSYSEISAVYCTTNKTFDSCHSAYLTDSLRYTGSIYSLLKQLCGTDPLRHGWISGMDFNPGTRVIGEKPQFICVKDCNTMKDKVQMLLQKMEEEGIRRDKIAVIKTGVSKDIIKDILQEECITKHLAGEVDFQSEASNLMSALGIGDDNLDIKDAHLVSFVHESDGQMNFSLRGMEFYHVIVCVTQMPNSFSDKKKLAVIKEGLMNKEYSQTFNCIHLIQDKIEEGWKTYITLDLVEAISRAVVGATIVYMEGDSFLSKIAEEFKSVSPEISQNDTCNKAYKVEQFIRKSNSKSALRALRYQRRMRSKDYAGIRSYRFFSLVIRDPEIESRCRDHSSQEASLILPSDFSFNLPCLI
ncbi:hypothetical protein QYM36_008779 [Artemia franciscana]|uniref:Uncharacterized protein n=2 Tax=Artemia franciscana TaxID=6661 RepID=A0AA88HM51_ARTSF|nr:hypothetical protein QYM36_008779 [Artemia franciscana]